MEKAASEGSVHSSGAGDAQNLVSEVLSQSEPLKTSSSEISRLNVKDDDEPGDRSDGRKRYSRDFLLKSRNSRLVKESPISLESEIFRELQVDNYYEQNAQPSSARAIQGSQQIGPQDPPVWKDDSWRMGNRFKPPGGPAIAGSPPTGLPLKSRLVDDGPLAGSPDKEKPPGAVGPPGGLGGPQRGPAGQGWRRPNEWRGDNEDNHDGWRPGNRQGSGMREEGMDRGDRRPVGGNSDEGWRPPPPGLGRGNNRGGGGGAPPGLGSNGEQWERPWGAGRGRLQDGERRLNGKPRDPPGIMPPRENNREPGVKPQLPEGWNKPLNRDEWRNGAKGKVWEDKNGRQASDDGSKGGNPSWMAAEPEDVEVETSLLEQRRNEVEAERKAKQEERDRAAKMSAAKSDPGQDLIADDEIEAMKLEAEEEERRERNAENEAGRPPRPASAQAGSLDFNVDSLFAPDSQSGPGSAVGRGEEAPELGSRFGRWFQLESSPSAPTALPPAEHPQQQQGQVPPQGPTPQQAADHFFQQQPQPSASEAAQIQQFLASRAQNSATPAQQELPRSLLAQLQQGQPGGGASTGSLSSLGFQGLQAQNQGQNQQQGQPGWPRQLSDSERAMLERQMMSPRDGMGMPTQQQQQQQQAPQMQQGQQGQQQQYANNPAANHALLQLLQGQQNMRVGQDPKLPPPRAATVEPTFANPNPQINAQQQQLLNNLNLAGQQGTQQQQQQQQMGANLLEQLQQLRFAQSQSNQLNPAQQAQLAAQQQQQAREREQHQIAQLRQQLAMQQQQQQQQQQQGMQGQAGAGAQNPLLAQFTAQMPRDTGLGVGRGDRAPNLNLGQQQQQQQNNLAHLLQQNPQFAHNLRQQAQASQAASNAFSGAPYGYSNAGSVQMGSHGLGQNVGLGQYARQAAPQPSFVNQGPGMGSAEAQSVARYLEQQRALEAASQAHNQKLLQQHRIFQMQQLAAQQQQREATQRAAAHAALLQQQQQHAAGIAAGSRLTPAEAVLRQQQMLQYQALNLGGGNQARGGNQPDTDALARFLSQHSSSGLNNLGGRPL